MHLAETKLQENSRYEKTGKYSFHFPTPAVQDSTQKSIWDGGYVSWLSANPPLEKLIIQIHSSP